MISTYEQIIDELILRLKGDVNTPAFIAMGVNVTKTVQYEGDYETLPAGAKSRISVGFAQNRYGTDENGTSMFIGNAVMDRSIYLQCSIAARELWGEKGAVKIAELCEQMALGYKPTVGGEVYVFATTLQAMDKGVWYYRVIVRVNELPLKPISSFITTGEEPLGGDLVEATFTPEFLE